MIMVYIVIGVIDAIVSLYFAWRYREFRKFLAGAFFVSSGILFYLYLAMVPVPLLGTDFVETPRQAGGRVQALKPSVPPRHKVVLVKMHGRLDQRDAASSDPLAAAGDALSRRMMPAAVRSTTNVWPLGRAPASRRSLETSTPTVIGLT